MNFAAVSSGAPNVSTRNHFLGVVWLMDAVRPPSSHPFAFWGSAGSNPIYKGIPASRCRWIFFPKDIPEGVAECRVKKGGCGNGNSEVSYDWLRSWFSKGVKSRDPDIIIGGGRNQNKIVSIVKDEKKNEGKIIDENFLQ